MRYVASVLILLAATLPIRSAGSAEPPTLEERAQAIDRAAQAPDGDRVVLGHISRKLGIPVETLRAQRQQTGLGWGEILIAHRLSQETGLTLDQIVAGSRGGKPWADIAREHNVDFAKLTSEIEQSQELIEQRAEDRAPHNDGANTSGRSGSAASRRGSGSGTGRGRR